MTGTELIKNERARQINEKGFDYEHDDTRSDGELLIPAIGLLLNAVKHPIAAKYLLINLRGNPEQYEWVDHIVSHNRPDNIKGLVIAGALICAEIDRLQRIK